MGSCLSEAEDEVLAEKSRNKNVKSIFIVARNLMKTVDEKIKDESTKINLKRKKKSVSSIFVH